MQKSSNESMVYRYIYQLTQDEELATYIVQEVFEFEEPPEEPRTMELLVISRANLINSKTIKAANIRLRLTDFLEVVSEMAAAVVAATVSRMFLVSIVIAILLKLKRLSTVYLSEQFSAVILAIFDCGGSEKYVHIDRVMENANIHLDDLGKPTLDLKAVDTILLDLAKLGCVARLRDRDEWRLIERVIARY